MPRTPPHTHVGSATPTRRAQPLKKRKLYQIRYEPRDGGVLARHVGFKARLVPRLVANRIAARLERSGLIVWCDPLIVNVTAEQAARLKALYGR